MTTVVRDVSRQWRSTSLVRTETTELQEDAELECRPFFVDLSKLSSHSLEHLRETGLLMPNNNNNNNTKEKENDSKHDLEICLVRSKHQTYLSRVLLPSEQPLGYSLVSLDASRPWMIYWTLHGTDLLLRNKDKDDKNEEASCSLLCETVGDDALCAVVSTLEACWQSIEVTLPQHLNLTAQDEELLISIPANDKYRDKSTTTTIERNSYVGGGFGGGPGQMAHAAVAYASVLTLCIVATSSGPKSANMAWELLHKIRKPLYAWLLSLQQSNGGFRMHHDGEVDVRASYTIFCIAKLLNILTPTTLASPLTIDYIASCQTYEGGFGGEPFTEAHGGYAYCAVAALQLVNRLHDHKTVNVDMDALLGWLARRQMPYEGGFSGRSNKLVDGCYSFWQGGAMAIVSAHYGTAQGFKDTATASSSSSKNATTAAGDPWLLSSSSSSPQQPISYALLFDKAMLQRYILLCAQDVSGGLRDKPSKPRDFYHSCYNLSGLSVTQHCGTTIPRGLSSDDNGGDYEKDYTEDNFGHPTESIVAATHPCYNIRLERVQKVLDHFKTET